VLHIVEKKLEPIGGGKKKKKETAWAINKAKDSIHWVRS
jgi:hypothetical protein